MLNPKIYDKKYLTSHRCEGYYEDLEGKLSPIKNLEMKMLAICERDVFLDVGCGRGEILAHVCKNSKNIYGVDYSRDAVSLTRKRLPVRFRKNILQTDARKIKLKSNSVNKILMGDIVEHMTFSEAVEMLDEAYRLLKPNGQLIIHTSPNRYFSKYIAKAVYAVLQWLGYKSVAKNFKANIDATRIYHVYEFSRADLKKLLSRSKFSDYKTWIHPDVLRVSSKNYLTPLKNNLMFSLFSQMVNRTVLLELFGNDLFAVATKSRS
jgi:ubiquinone/menaquinone biosynthesis C-methylase UbiE